MVDCWLRNHNSEQWTVCFKTLKGNFDVRDVVIGLEKLEAWRVGESYGEDIIEEVKRAVIQ